MNGPAGAPWLSFDDAHDAAMAAVGALDAGERDALLLRMAGLTPWALLEAVGQLRDDLEDGPEDEDGPAPVTAPRLLHAVRDLREDREDLEDADDLDGAAGPWDGK